MMTVHKKENREDPGPVIVTDAAVVTALGDDLDIVWQGVLNGESAIRPVSRFDVDKGGYAAGIAALIGDLRSAGGRSLLIALLDRLMKQINSVPSDAALVTATIKSGIDHLEALCRNQPAVFADILLTAAGRRVEASMGRSAPPFANSICISASCASSTIAVAHGAAMITAGMTDTVLVCCADVVTEYVFSGFSCLKALSPYPCKPFDARREGLSLGEGAAALLLMSASRAEREGRRRLGTIRGWGISNDAAHITAPVRGGKGLIQAVDDAFTAARVTANDIAAVCAHGTGTVYNDRMELDAFGHLFGRRSLPVFSVKGAIGHTLGAAGGIEVALGLKALSVHTAPPTAGFKTPEEGAEGRVKAERQPMEQGCLLTTNSGFGGVNAALVLAP